MKCRGVWSSLLIVTVRVTGTWGLKVHTTYKLQWHVRPCLLPPPSSCCALNIWPRCSRPSHVQTLPHNNLFLYILNTHILKLTWHPCLPACSSPRATPMWGLFNWSHGVGAVWNRRQGNGVPWEAHNKYNTLNLYNSWSTHCSPMDTNWTAQVMALFS